MIVVDAGVDAGEGYKGEICTMVQKSYQITVEAVTQRTVVVYASNIDEAEELGRNEVKNLVGAVSTEIIEARKLSEEPDNV